MAVMTDEKRPVGRPHKKPNVPRGKRSTLLVAGRVDADLAERFFAFIERYRKLRIRTDKSAHIEKAVGEYLSREEPNLEALERGTTPKPHK